MAFPFAFLMINQTVETESERVSEKQKEHYKKNLGKWKEFNDIVRKLDETDAEI